MTIIPFKPRLFWGGPVSPDASPLNVSVRVEGGKTICTTAAGETFSTDNGGETWSEGPPAPRLREDWWPTHGGIDDLGPHGVGGEGARRSVRRPGRDRVPD